MDFGGIGKHASRVTPIRLDTRLAKLAQYYLECISFDDEGEVSMFAESRHSPDYNELADLPLISEAGIVGALQSDAAQQLAYSIRRDKKRLGHRNYIL